MEFIVRSLRKEELETADYIMRVAFGTFMSVPDPSSFGEGMDHVRTRWLADPNAAFGAETDGELVGSIFATRWGSFGFFGPLTVRPDLWDRGIAKLLLEPTMELFNRWGVSHVGLFTFAQSPKHIGLYEKFGFWPRFLTFVMSKTVQRRGTSEGWSKFSDVPDVEIGRCLEMCRSLTNSVYEGLDLEREIMAVRKQGLGDTVLLWEGETVVGVAVCHCGLGTEAGRDTCYVKFGAVRSGASAENFFDRLLSASEELATMKGMADVVAGVNSGCHNAYRRMIARGFRADFQGVLMLKPNEATFDRPDRYVLCDLR
ncbi:MAG: GNAT family N-acetyltransferase [Candidatus Bathyarchaeia archaeon]|jgi:predicted N-acetyltransferase YhbS